MLNPDVQPILLTMVAMIPIGGATMALMPLLQPHGEVFSVSVPTVARDDLRVRSLVRRYIALISAVTVLFALASLALCIAGSANAALASIVAGTLAVLAVGYGLLLRYRAKMQVIKRESGWKAASAQRVAAVGEDSAATPRPISLAWNLLYIPVVLLTVAVVLVGYDSMPDTIPMHVDISGNADRIVAKSPAVAALPVALELFLAAMFAFSHWAISRSKKGIEPGHPASSAWAYGMFARAQAVYLLVSGLAVTASCGLLMALAMLDVVSMMSAVLAIIVVAVGIALGGLIVSMVYGQSGSRVFRMEASDVLLADDDRFWKLGMLYCNPDDASLFLPQRSGVGWTVNWGRPAAWVLLAGFALVVVVFVTISVAIAS